jgi:flagellar basal-body rod modification protein FlgD
MATTPAAISGISSDQFLQLLISQLQNQDPLNPVSSQDFLSQLASLTTVESLNGLSASFSQQLKLQQLSQGTELIGKTIAYTPTGGGANKTGTVSSVSVQNGNYVLNVGSDQVSLDQIQSVQS